MIGTIIRTESGQNRDRIGTKFRTKIVEHKQANSDTPTQTNGKVAIYEKCWQKGNRILF